MTFSRAIGLAVAVFLVSGLSAQGQLEIRNPERFNASTYGDPLADGHPQPGTQFSSAGGTSGSAGPISPSDPGFPQAKYPDVGAQTGAILQLRSARVGGSYATGVPRYFLGDQIRPPEVQADNTTPAGPGYWRAAPMRPGELIRNPDGSVLKDVTDQPLANTNGPSGTPVAALAADEYETFYYSPHADRVFASQAGTVEIIWVSSTPEGAGGGAWQFRVESFNVSGAASREVRTIYWTEKSFDAPRVNIPAGRIERVNPIYYSSFEAAVDEEYVPLGQVDNPDPNAEPAEEKRTLWFEKLSGNGQLAAYNQEGRILVEYLGAETSPGRHEFLGADIVEVVRVAPAGLVTVKLGHQVLAEDQDADLTGAPLQNLGAGDAAGFFATRALADGQQVFYAERENLNPDRIVFYWLEEKDAAVQLLPEPEVAPGGGVIDWGAFWDVLKGSGSAVIDGTTVTIETQNQHDPNLQPNLTVLEAVPSIWTITFSRPVNFSLGFASVNADTERVEDFSVAPTGTLIDPGHDWDGSTLVSNGAAVDDASTLSWTTISSLSFVHNYDLAPTAALTLHDALFTVVEDVDPEPEDVEPEPISILWPKYKNRYRFIWPEGLDEYAHVTTDPGGSQASTGLQFASGSQPEIVFQDDGDQSESGFDADTRRLVVDLSGSGDGWNRTLLRFSSGNDVWYQPLYSQDESRGSYEEGDGLPPVATTASVGTRIGRPADKYSLAGAITGGTGYQESAYLDPYSVGVEVAEAGAIIPVNALPGDDLLSVRWFEKIEPPSAAFEAFYVPSKVGRYQVSFPDDLGDWRPAVPLAEERGFHTSTLLADGRVLSAGGFSSANGILSSAELYDPATGQWRGAANLNTGSASHTATLLESGKVMVFGGLLGPGIFSGRSEIFDPLTEAWTSVAPAAQERRRHTATLLADGTVLVTGGQAGAALASCEVYDPTTDVWATVASLNEPRMNHTATLLRDGTVLVVGGLNPDFGTPVFSAELYNPVDRTWSVATPPTVARETPTATRLDDGSVLVVGGRSASPSALPFGGTDTLVAAPSRNPFYPGGGRWRVDEQLDTNSFLESPTLSVPASGEVVLSFTHDTNFEEGWDGGRVLVKVNGGAYQVVPFPGQELVRSFSPAEGWTGVQSGVVSTATLFTGEAGDFYQFRFEQIQDDQLSNTGPNWTITGVAVTNSVTFELSGPSNSAEIFNPASGTWSATGNLSESRFRHTATLMPDGKVLAIAGFVEFGNSGERLRIASTEVFDPGSGTWGPAKSLAGIRANHEATLLGDGRLLVDGGNDGDYIGTTELLETVSPVVMASNQGTVGLTAAQAAGKLYVQNQPGAIGYNPNEEHGWPAGGTFFALRDDLNVTSPDDRYTSDAFLLVAYTDPDDGRPAMRPFKVLREDSRYRFQYPWTAGTKLQGPMPLPLLPLALNPDGSVANVEVAPAEPDLAPDPTGTAPELYDRFTYEDRQGYKWVYRGPHAAAGPAPTLGMRWYYPMQPGFFVPGVSPQPALGTKLPYLRPPGSTEDPVDSTALIVSYTPTWPESAPSLRVAETLTLPKFGLPDVRNQKSAEVLYQQSVAVSGAAKRSVRLHDPTRQKSMALADVGLEKIPGTIRTTNYQGKTYFQGLPPHLQRRFYLDPLASTQGSLVFAGEFHDEIAGEDYLELNVLSSADETALKDLAQNEETAVKGQWDDAIDLLNTRMETFIEDPSRKGTYVVDPSRTADIGENELAETADSDTARDSYALTSSGLGDGYVTLLFSDGEVPNLTPEGDPPVMQIIKILPELYNGDLKVQLSSNPLDEKVTLRHSGDFAARPEDYVFEWRYAGLNADGSAPRTYVYTNETYLGNVAETDSKQWRYLQNPGSARPSENDYSAGAWELSRQITINGEGSDPGSGFPGVVLKSRDGVNFSTELPANITFSAELGDLDGFVLYVNGAVALVHGNGIPALDPLLSENAYDLALKRPQGVDELPAEGENLIVVAEIAGVLQFRVFDAAGAMVVDDDETGYAGQSAEIAALKGILAGLWATTNLASTDKSGVVEAVAAILEFDLDSDASTGLSGNGLSKQFAVSPGFFTRGINRVEVALFSVADAGVSSTVDFRLEGSTKDDQVVAGAPWIDPMGDLSDRIVVGGSPTAALGSPLLVMRDNYFTMRYRAKEFLPDPETGLPTATLNPAYGLTGGAYSDWARPALIEGWIKRVLAAINPFNQRITDLFNNGVNTDVSLLTQAGSKWEGDVALTLDAIDDAGLIAIYETVLNRGKEISIDSGYGDDGVNNALLLAAGYLHDLYSILGNEAFADAANPTISIDDQDTVTEINTSRFSFEGQAASVLEEELALLRGRDDFSGTAVTQSPFYNRLFWNYTRGINSGEALYATNYNIKEKVGSSTEDGNIDAADAERMFPQGHGDAYGHYLTSLKGYYQLLTNPNFTWKPRPEQLNILGNTIEVDYQDERKFAEGAANLARGAEQVVALTHRQQYHDDPDDGWAHFRDGERGGNLDLPRHWGLDEWTSRSTQGAYYHWAVGNAMLPDVDTKHSGIQKIDRSSVPELERLAVSGESLQTTLDNASAHLNPLGLSPGAIAFDIDPVEMRNGHSHYEQVHERALSTVLNAKGSFDQAAKMTRLLRNQENQIDAFNTAIEDEERAFNYKLIDLYGSPYPGDVGPGKTYAQGYDGPDLTNWFVTDRPSGLVDTTAPVRIEARVPVNLPKFDGFDNLEIAAAADEVSETATRTVEIRANRFVQFADLWRPGVDLGARSVTGRVQQALGAAELAYVAVVEASNQLADNYEDFDRKAELVLETIAFHESIHTERALSDDAAERLGVLKGAAELKGERLRTLESLALKLADALAEAPPKANGFSNDVTSTLRSAIKLAATATAKISANQALKAEEDAIELGGDIQRLDRTLTVRLEEVGFSFEESQLAYEFEVALREMGRRFHEVAQLSLQLQRAAEEVRTVMALGDRLQLEREIFRKRAATVVQGYRTNDLTFRTFRSEALEQYRTLFDLASRYTYLSAKSYDYETGLLGTAAGQKVIAKIVAARALGDLAGGQPQATVSTLGDAGLAGMMAQLQADWSVAEGRLGINNPDQNGTLFSLRQELFRIMDDPDETDDDTAWRQVLEQHTTSDLMSDPHAAIHCRNLRKSDGAAVPGIVIPFSSTIEHGKNFFGLPSAGGDHAFSASNFATKIYSAGVVLEGYIGMDPYSEFIPGAGEPASNDPGALMATPYLYLIPVGVDKMLAPPLGDTGVERSWMVQDQALPLPYNLGANAFSTTQFFNANGTLTEQPWILRKHQAFRPVDDPVFFYSGLRDEFDSSRLIGRSVWNTQWKIIIPAYALHNNEQKGLDRFAKTVSDIKLFLRTYSHSGN